MPSELAETHDSADRKAHSWCQSATIVRAVESVVDVGWELELVAGVSSHANMFAFLKKH
jgi:hypothetical protein